MYYSFGDKTNGGGISLEKSGCSKIIFYLLIQEIKISMTCVYKQYEVKTKMVQEQLLQVKMKFLLGYNMKIAI